MDEKSKRPEWLWESNRSAGMKMPQGRIDDEDQIRAYIEHLEARFVRDCKQITDLWERLGEYRGRIKELEAQALLENMEEGKPDIERLVEVAHVAYCEYWNYLHPELMKRGPAEAIVCAILKDLGHEGETTDPYPTAISDPYGAPHAVEPERCPGEGAHPHTVCLGCGGCHSFVSCSNSTLLCSNKVGAQSLISTEEPGCPRSDAMGGTDGPEKGLDIEGKRLSDTVWVPHQEPEKEGE